jgi:hypothetical protein
MLVPALAAAALLVAVVLLAVASKPPPTTELARLATQPATAPTPAVDTSRPALLERRIAGVDFPN